MRIAFGTLAFVAMSFAAHAQVTSIGPFTGAIQESFESKSGTAVPCVPQRIFNDQADACTPNGNGVYVTSGWSFMCQIPPNTGSRFCGMSGGALGGGMDITFDSPVTRFGGYFGMNHTGGPDITVTFYAGDTIVSGPTAIPMAVDCNWNWLGWSMGGFAVDRINLKSNHNSTGYLHMDDLEADTDACTVKYGASCAGSGGFTPKLTAANCPVSGSTLTIDIHDALGGSTAILLLGASPAAIPVSPACTMNVAPLFPAITVIPLLGVGPGDGFISIQGPIPTIATGASFVSQIFVVDPGVARGYSTSRGLQLNIQ